MLIAAIALLVIGVMFGSIAAWVLGWSSFKLAQGDLRCEGAGAVVINIAGEDYAVNAIAGWQYPPVPARLEQGQPSRSGLRSHSSPGFDPLRLVKG